MKLHYGLMSIGDFASYCGSTRQTMQYYDRIGLLRPLQTGEQGYRFYHPLQGHEVRLIHSLQRSGCSLEEVKDILNSSSIETLERRIEEKQRDLEQEQLRILREQTFLKRFYLFLTWSSQLPPNTPILYRLQTEMHVEEIVWVRECEPFTEGYYEMILKYAEYCRVNHAVQTYPYALYVDPAEMTGRLRFSRVFVMPEDQNAPGENGFTITPGDYLCIRSYPDPQAPVREGVYDFFRRYMAEHGLRPTGGSFEIPFCIPHGLRREQRHFTVIFILPVEKTENAGGEEA